MNNEIEVSSLSKIGEPSASIIKVAATLPARDLVQVEKNIRGALQNNPSLAVECIYCKPVGKEDGKMQFATGPSIRFTELGQQCFGRLWVNGFSENDGKRVSSTVMCFDLSTLNITVGTHSKSIIGKFGKYTDGMIETTTNATFSIARRNALLQQMRPQLESCMSDAAAAAIYRWSDKCDHAEAYRAISADYQKRWGTTPAQIKSLAEREENKDDQLILLIGVRNFLIDNPDKYSDVFGNQPAKQGKSQSEPPKQTEQQKYNTLKLQIEGYGNAQTMSEILSEYMGKVAKGEKDFDDADYKILNGELENLLKREAKK
jgi:hypothetical protein